MVGQTSPFLLQQLLDVAQPRWLIFSVPILAPAAVALFVLAHNIRTSLAILLVPLALSPLIVQQRTNSSP